MWTGPPVCSLHVWVILPRSFQQHSHHQWPVSPIAWWHCTRPNDHCIPTAHLGLRLSPASGAKHRDLEVGRRALAWIAAVPNLVVACNTSPRPSVEALKSRGLGQHACNPDCLPNCRCRALYGTVPPIAYLSVVEPSCEAMSSSLRRPMWAGFCLSRNLTRVPWSRIMRQQVGHFMTFPKNQQRLLI